jgi:pimeloyl-ACP methyl ester carboxylesterase
MQTQTTSALLADYSDAALLQKFPGFTNHYVTVNGVQLHYVEGGSGQPLVCLPGWPQTWYSFHPIAAALAAKYRVIILDIRGMGSSDKPAGGYDKKTMAQDVYALTQLLGLPKVSLLGHDIGGMVAMSFAFNHPEATEKLIVLDGGHPSEGMRHMSLLPAPGAFQAKMDGQNPYVWWMAFNQVKELPEQLLAGRFRYLLDCELYASVYNDPANIRAANAWYQAFEQDMEDANAYPHLTMPVLGVGSYVSFNHMQMSLPYVAENLQLVAMLDSGHYMFEENPTPVIAAVTDFLG